MYAFVDVARALAPHQPVYGLQAVGLDGSTPRHESVEAMAQHYAAQIRALRPHGPCHLAGYSLGGWIAYATAAALLRQGVPVGRLILLDTQATACHPRWIGWAQRGARLAQRLYQTVWPPARARRQPPHVPRALPDARRPLHPLTQTDHYLSAHQRYQPPRLPVRVDVITPQHTPPQDLWFWHHYAQGSCTLHRLLHDHFDYIDPAHAPALAELLHRLLADTPETP